ncbi:MAG: hypothetical protein R2831_03705 [Chitinophagaceae bacterium]
MNLKTKPSYIIIEDIPEIAEKTRQIISEMNDDWEFLGVEGWLEPAQHAVLTKKPDIIYLDYEINGGYTFEIIDAIMELDSYKPFIIFNTSFMAQKPQIAESLSNKYKNYIGLFFNKKNLFQQLKIEMPRIREDVLRQLKPAEIQLEEFFPKDIYCKQIHNVCPQDIVHVSIFDASKRSKSIFLNNGSNIIVKKSFSFFSDLFKFYDINFFFTNKKFSMVNKSHIVKYNRPFVYFKHPIKKVEVARENVIEFERWLCD